MGFLEALTLIFIVLKIIGEITWSWFWVLSPLVPAAVLWIFAGSFIVGLFAKIWKELKN